MNVFIIASGKSAHAPRWARALNDRGLEVSFVTIHNVTTNFPSSIEVLELSSSAPLGYLTGSVQLQTYLNRRNPDLVHSHYATGYGTLGALVRHPRKIISIYGSDIFDFPHKSPVHKWYLKKVLASYDVRLSTSEVMADETISTYPVLKRPLVTPFGVDLDKFHPGGRFQSERNEQITVGIVKKIADKYGIDILLRAFAKAKTMVPGSIDLRLKIGGDGEGRQRYETLSEKLGLRAAHVFDGFIDHEKVPDYLRSVDIFVAPSRQESFGVAAVEAQAVGCAVVVSNVGGLPEVVANGTTGTVVEKESVQETAEAICLYASDPKLRRQHGQAAVEHVREYYSWEASVDRMLSIYRDALN